MAAPVLAPDDPGTWTDAEPLECCAVVPEAPDVATISFVAPSGAWFRYRPGQFLTLELPVPGGAVWRTYTLSSSPSRPLGVSITVKAQAASVGTRWMLDRLRPGMRLRAKGPAGIFTIPTRGKGKYLFISAGTGVTPSLAMTNYLYDRGTDIDVVLVSCARRPAEIIGRRRLELMASRVPEIKLHFIVEQDDPYDVWTGYRGRLNQIMLGLIASDYLEREVYCCGPEPFMQAVRDMLIALGFDMARYNQESFAVAVETEADAPELNDFVPDEGRSAEIVFAGSGVTAAVSETETVLQAAKAAGLNIPNGCNFGVCGTCKVHKIAGEVHMVHNGGISAEDIDAGYILACCSRPIGRVEVAV
jgi:ferredoxin-NADP reductase